MVILAWPGGASTRALCSRMAVDTMQQPPLDSVGAGRRHAVPAFVSIRWSHPQDAPDFSRSRGKPIRWRTARSTTWSAQQSCSRLLPLLHRRGVTDAAARRQQASARSPVEWHAPPDLAVGAGRFSRVFRVDAARRWVWHTPCFLAACCAVLLLGLVQVADRRLAADTATLFMLCRPVLWVLQVQIKVSTRLLACCDLHAHT